MKRYLMPAVVVVLLAVFAVWWLSPTQVIKRRTKSFLEVLTLEAGEGKVGRQAGSYAFDGLLAPQVELENPKIEEANGTFERAELDSAYSWLCDAAKETRFELKSIKSITINGNTAKVELTLFGLVELPTYKPADGTYDVTFDWTKAEDGWRLKKAVWK